MKVVFQANNGKVFDSQDQAEKEDGFIREINQIIDPFLKDDIESEKYIQRTYQQIDDLIHSVYKVLIKYYGESSETAKLWKQNPRGIVGRYFCDSNSPAYNAYFLLESIDNKNRQWNQPYFAIQSNKNNT